MKRHPLDGNAIAADAHYDRPMPYDHSYCENCLYPFADDSDDHDEITVIQHDSRFHLCKQCAEDS